MSPNCQPAIPETGPRVVQNQVAVAPTRQSALPASSPQVVNRQPRIDEVYPARTSTEPGGGTRPLRTAEGDITLNFDNADVREVARVILGNLLGLNYIVDPGVAGTISLASERPLRRDDLLPTLEAILAGQGIQLVNYGNVLRLTRANDAQARAGGGIGFGAGTAYRVFPLQFIAAAQLETVLTPLLPAGALAVVDPVRNLVVVTGDSAAMRLAAGTIDIFDVNRMATQTSAIVTLEEADAVVVGAELANIFAATGSLSGGDGEPGALQLIPIERLNGILIVGQNRELVEDAREWIFRLDRKRDPAERRVFVYYVQHGGAERIATALNEILSGNGGGATNDGEASDTTATPAGLSDDDLRISVDSENNALLVSTTTPNFTLILDVLQRLDIQPLQVMIETSIFEVSLRDDLRFGVQYAINNGGVGIGEGGTISFGNTDKYDDRAWDDRQSSHLARTGGDRHLDHGGWFQLHDRRGLGDALHHRCAVRPDRGQHDLLAQRDRSQQQHSVAQRRRRSTDHHADHDQHRHDEPVDRQHRSISADRGQPRSHAAGQRQRHGHAAVVTGGQRRACHHLVHDQLAHDPKPQFVEHRLCAQRRHRSSGRPHPRIGGRRAHRIPLLNELPIVGNLFGRTTETTQRTELVILIRPVIISTPEEATSVTQSMRNKFLSLVRQEREGIRQPRAIPGAGR